MEILIFDDTIENIEAAKVAAAGKPEHGFSFETSAKSALTKLQSGKVEGLITDFFAPVDPEMEEAWQRYLDPLKVYARITNFRTKATQDYTNREEIDLYRQVAEVLQDEGFYRLYTFHRDIWEEFNDIINDSNSYLKEFHGYGGALMLEAQRLQIPSVLVTDMHRHSLAIPGRNPMNGTALLTPLVAAGLCNYDEIRELQGNQILLSRGADGREAKSDPKVWDLAIQMLVAQEQNNSDS
jgi:hypothetical protein